MEGSGRAQGKTHLEVATTEDTLVEHNGIGDQAGLLELDIGIALGVAGKFVEQDGNTVDCATALEMSLDLLGRGAVVDVANEDAARVNVLLVLAQTLLLLVEAGLHLAQLCGLGFHLLHPLLHCGNLGLVLVVILGHIDVLFLAGSFVVRHGVVRVGVLVPLVSVAAVQHDAR